MKRKTLFFLVLTVMLASTVSAQVADQGVSVTLLKQTPDPARAGETVEVRFEIENLGGTATGDMTFELVPKYPFTEIPGEEYVKTVSSMKGYQQGAESVIIKYEVRVDKDAVKGTNQLQLKWGKSGSDVYVIEDFDIEVTGTEYAQIIYVDKAKLNPGEETEMKFTVTNVGNSPLQNLVFSWSEENGVILPVYSDDTKYIKYVDVGESVDLAYIVVADVNADPGLYKLDLSLSYETQEGVSQEMNTRAGIFIGGETDFDVTFSESSGGETSISIANIGNVPALSVTVRIPEQEGYTVTGSPSSIVGNLDKGDYTIVSFQVSQSMRMPARSFNQTQPMGTMETDNHLLVLIEYTDTTGTRHSVEKSIRMQSDSLNATSTDMSTRFAARSNPYTGIINMTVVLVAAACLIVCYKKRKAIRKGLGRFRKKKG